MDKINGDPQDISFETIYSKSDEHNTSNKIIREQLLKPYSDDNCCDRWCLWWFFHSGSGLESSKKCCYISSSECICCNFCSWFCQCKYNTNKCCIKHCECCCISCFQYI